MSLKVGMIGTIIGVTAKGDKLSIEFDKEVFTDYNTQVSSFDNGCYGKGKLHHCLYIPHAMVFHANGKDFAPHDPIGRNSEIVSFEQRVENVGYLKASAEVREKIMADITPKYNALLALL